VIIIAILVAILGLLWMAFTGESPDYNGRGRVPHSPASSVQPANPNGASCDSCTTPIPGLSRVSTAPPPVADASCAAGVVESTEIPSFAFAYTRNEVRYRVQKWTASYSGGCTSATVEGRDDKGRVVSHQEYGNGLAFISQWVMTYSWDVVQVDRYESYSSFAGRTVYTYNPNNGALQGAERLDGHERLLSTMNVLDDGAVVLKHYDPENGTFQGSQTYDAGVAPSVMANNFYLYTTYGS
jgi:hypothetical protein